MPMDQTALLREIKNGKELRASFVARRFGVSRQYASRTLSEFVDRGMLVKIGATKNAFYVSPSHKKAQEITATTHIANIFRMTGLEEDRVFELLERKFPRLRTQRAHVRQIFRFTFSEMLNNAIEHSHSKVIETRVAIVGRLLCFEVRDHGIGIFLNIMRKRKLSSELEAIQDLLKGKTTTMPERHSGEGIFFTSKLADFFEIESRGYRLLIDNKLDDIFVGKTPRTRKGTFVRFSIAQNTTKHIEDVFRRYTNQHPESDHGFDKTEVRVKLYALGDEHISRSQARRVLAGLEKFKVIIFDFAEVRLVGQAFADEIFRVFQRRHPTIRLEIVHADNAAEFMIARAKMA